MATRICFIAAVAESGHQAEPVFTFQFFSGDSLDHVQQLLGDEAFEFAEGLLLKNRPHWVFVGVAFAEDQRANFFKQRRWRVRQFSLQFFLRCRSASFASSPFGSFKNSSIFS